MEPVYLRALELSDLERTHKWHNDPELYKMLGGTFRYTSRATEEDWLRRKQTYSVSVSEVNLAVCLAESLQHIGNIYLRNMDWVARNAELHIFIGEPDQRSKGYGEAAVRLLINYAFQDLGLLRLYLFVLEDNTPAMRVYEKCGFIVEGKLRRHAFKEGKFKDVLVMGICASDLSSGGA